MNDSELALLALLAELKAVTGYGLASVSNARGMHRWAGLSVSSVYKGLRRLSTDGLVQSAPARQKRGKGPPGRLFAVTTAGARRVRQALTDGLLRAPEQSPRYRVSLAFVDLIGPRRALAQLQARARELRRRRQAVERARRSEPRARGALGAALVFEYVLRGLVHEQLATARLIEVVRKHSRA